MSSAAQIQANQQNARKSTGPVTEDGEEASSQNAAKHGIFARIVPDAEHRFPELLESIREAFEPKGGMENTIVEQVALAYFRLQRLYAYEQQACTLRDSAQHDLEALDYEAREQGVKLPVIGIISVLAGEAARVATFKGYAESPADARLIRYEAMLNRQIQRNLELLNTIQAARKAREEKARRKADDRRIRDLKDRMGSKALLIQRPDPGRDRSPAGRPRIHPVRRAHTARASRNVIRREDRARQKHLRPHGVPPRAGKGSSAPQQTQPVRA